MKQTLFLLLISLILFSCHRKAYQKPVKVKPDYDEMTMDAFLDRTIYEGLKDVQFPSELAVYVSQHSQDFFVGKCPICRPVERGFQKYVRDYPRVPMKKKYEKMQGIWEKGEAKDRHASFRDFINSLVEKEFAESGMSEETKARFQQEMEAGRKKGMGLMQDGFGDFCPSCDGACSKKDE